MVSGNLGYGFDGFAVLAVAVELAIWLHLGVLKSLGGVTGSELAANRLGATAGMIKVSKRVSTRKNTKTANTQKSLENKAN
jgi:hypothetical protein